MVFLLLHVLSYVAAVIAFIFCTLSLASGLLYIAEIIEEHSRLAKTVGQRLIYVIIAIHVLLKLNDQLPTHLILLGIVCHLVYLSNFSKTWPFISLTSFSFIASCVLVLTDHFAWFFYFTERAKAANYHYSRYRASYAWSSQHTSKAHEPLSFLDVATFFGLCVWLVPFYLFLSLSANDHVLPSNLAASHGPSGASPSDSPRNRNQLHLSTPSSPQFFRRKSMLHSFIEPVMAFVPTVGGQQRGSRRQRDGLIASPKTTPRMPFWGVDNPTSLPPSPVANPSQSASYNRLATSSSTVSLLPDPVNISPSSSPKATPPLLPGQPLWKRDTASSNGDVPNGTMLPPQVAEASLSASLTRRTGGNTTLADFDSF